jgi:hypothetical protein
MKFILIIILLTYYSLTSYAQKNHLLLNLDLKDNKINKIFYKAAHDNSSIIFSDSVIRFPGQRSLRFEVKSSNEGLSGVLSEYFGKPEPYRERWYSLSIYPPSDYLPDPEREIVTQWHNVNDADLGEKSISPSLSLWVKNGRWSFHVLWDTAKITKQDHWMGQVIADLGNVKLNSWTDWVFHIIWSYKADGLVEVYKNGTKVYSRRGPNDFNDEKLPIWQFGIYKWVYTDHNAAHHKFNHRVLFVGELKEGNEKANLSDMIAKP